MEPHTTRIPIWRTLVNWIAVVLLGSIISPALLGGFAPGIILLFLLFSSVFSLPALIIFVFVNMSMNKQQLPVARRRLNQALIHFGVSVLTFLVILFAFDFDELDFMLPVAATYTILGQIAWWITFNTHRTAASSVSDHQTFKS